MENSRLKTGDSRLKIPSGPLRDTPMDPSSLLRKKPSSILILLKDTGQKWHLSKLAKFSGSTYVYVTRLLKKFQSEGVVTIKKEGRSKLVLLTEKGAAISQALDSLLSKMSPGSPPQQNQPETPAEEKKKPQGP